MVPISIKVIYDFYSDEEYDNFISNHLMRSCNRTMIIGANLSVIE